MKINKQILLAASCLALLFASPSQAGLVLTLDAGGGNKVTITDGGIGDLDSGTGSIAWFGSLGSWIFNFTAGLSTLNPGSLELTSFNATSRRGGTLTITLTDDSFSGAVGSNLATNTSINGVTSGAVTFATQFNGTNIGNFASTGPAYSGTTTANVVDTTGGFSLTQIATITHTRSGVTGFNMITTVPEPATLGLLGLGLIGLAFVRRRQATN